MAQYDDSPRKGQRFRTLEERGASPREVMPALPGPHDDGRFGRLKDVRHDFGAQTAEMRALEPVEEAPIQPPMKSITIPVLFVVAMFVALGAIVASFFR